MNKTIWKLFTLLLLFSFMATPALAQVGPPEVDRLVEGQDQPGARTVPSLAVSETGLYVVQLVDPSLSRYTGGFPNLAATSPEVTGVSKLDTAAPASVAYLDYLAGKQGQFISQMNTAVGRSVSVEFQYKNVLNALAVAVSHEEALALTQLPGVSAVYPDSLREIETDVGPTLIGAPTFWDGEFAHRGEGVIIGFLDSGVNPVHPSFAGVDGDGYAHTNPFGAGNYVGVCDDTDPTYDDTFPCNGKLIGAWNFHPSSPSAFDINNHGSHVGSTISGNRHNATFTVGLDEFTRTISGVAPRANVISYLVCYPSCPGSSSVAAVDQAIDDGVDVLNYSISGGDSPWDDAVDLAFLDAFAAGMFVSASAGNAGPGASTVAKTGPWNASVAASTHNRVIANTVDVTNPSPPAPELVGMAAVPGSGPSIIADIEGEVIWSGTVAPENVTGCDPFPAGAFVDAIALIIRGGCTFETKVTNATNAGAKAVIVYNSVGGPPITMGGLETTTVIPAVMIDNVDGGALLAALADAETVEAVINFDTSVIVNDDWTDVMAGLSSRGPSQWDLLKPDYTAPGVNILAAGWDGADAYAFLQGTSMSSPHGAGAAALMVQRYPDWSPAEIKSALAMTAWQDVLNDDGVNPAGFFDMGSGRIDLTEGALIGLVMDETADNFWAADPLAGGEPKTLNMPSMVDQDCIESCSWTRTVRSVLDGPADYQVIAEAPAGMLVTVVPDVFTIAAGATQELEITVDVDLDVLDAGAWAYAQIELEPVNGESIATHKLPIAVVPLEMEVVVAPIIEVSPEALESSQVADAQVTLPLDILNTGFDDLDWTIEEAPGMDSVLAGVGFEEGFDDITLLPGLGWALINNSAPLGTSGWFQGNLAVFPSHSGDPNSYIGANFNNTAGVGTISNWLLTPEITMNNGDVFSFYTRRTGSIYQDRLHVRLSTSGDSIDVGTSATDVGDFDTLLLDINPTYAAGGYPSVWTQYEITISGLTEPTSGRLALRYFVENGGSSGSNSDYIGIDTVEYAPGLPCDNPQDVPWLSVLPTSGQVSPGEMDTVNVTIDSTGLEADSTHEAFLCVSSNDMNNPVVPVPVTLHVVESAFVQVAHLAPFAEDASVTITLNGAPALTEFGYGDSTEYIELPVGEYDIAVIPTGGTEPAIEATVTLAADTYYTVIAIGDIVNQDLALQVLVDDLTPPEAGKFHLRLGHLAPFAAGPATADVRLKDGTPVLEDVDFGDVSVYLELDAGEYDLVITTPGGGTILIDPQPVTFVAGQIISAFATGEGVNQDLGVFALPAGVEGFFLPLVVEEPETFQIFMPLIFR